jgi:hypothetical protein
LKYSKPTPPPGASRLEFESDYTAEVKFASGTTVEPVPTSIYRVTIRYREPGFERRLGRSGAEAYRWTYRIEAIDVEAARQDAVRQFEDTAKQSQVGWRRDIVGVDVEPGEPPPR